MKSRCNRDWAETVRGRGSPWMDAALLQYGQPGWDTSFAMAGVRCRASCRIPGTMRAALTAAAILLQSTDVSLPNNFLAAATCTG